MQDFRYGKRFAISTAVVAVLVVVIIVVAGVAVYIATRPSSTTQATSTVSSTTQATSTVSSAALKVYKILMFIDSPASASWSQMLTYGLNNATLALNNTNGYTLKTTILYNANPTDTQSYISTYAAQGYNMIIPGDVTFEPGTEAVASQYPNIQFFGIGGWVNNNYSNIGLAANDQWRSEFLAGAVAGAMTKSNILGFVDAYNYPQIVEAINAYLAGAKLVNPNVKIVYSFTESWSDTVAGQTSASGLAAKGADIVACFGSPMSDGCIKGAAGAGVYSIGYLADNWNEANSSVLTSIGLNQTIYFYKAIQLAQSKNLGLSNRFTVVENLSRVRSIGSRENTQQSGFPCPVLPYQAVDSAPAERETYVIVC